MNFDDMKNAWNNDSGGRVSLPKNIDQLKAAGTPVDQMRSTMKHEFFFQVTMIVLIGFVPLFYKFEQVLVLPYYCLYTVCLIICIYYLVRLFLFGKRLGRPVLNSKENLYELYYDIKVHIEIYKSWCYALSPFTVFFATLFVLNAAIQKKHLVMNLNVFDEKLFFICMLITIPTVILTMIATEFWVKKSYGRYPKQLKAILDEFTED